MSLTVLTNASSGATRNSGTNGDLCALLDWALVQEGWAIEYSSGNARVYRPATGTRFRLHVNHDSSVSGGGQRAVVRGCEGASGATTLVDPYPLVAQVADTSSNWLVSSTANTVDRPFTLVVSPTFVLYFSCISGAANEWSMGWAGDLSAEYSGDNYCAAVLVRNSAGLSAATGGIGEAVRSDLSGVSLGLYWARDITGATKSSRGVLCGSGVTLGQVTGAPAARGGYQNAVYREPVGVSDLASTSTPASVLALLKRGWIPNLWSPLHLGRGSLSDGDTFGDSAYDPTAVFRALSSSAVASPFVILEETDTWSAP